MRPVVQNILSFSKDQLESMDPVVLVIWGVNFLKSFLESFLKEVVDFRVAFDAKDLESFLGEED